MSKRIHRISVCGQEYSDESIDWAALRRFESIVRVIRISLTVL